MRDRYERKHRHTNSARRDQALTPAVDAPEMTLAEAMGIEGRPSNLVAEINGHHIYRDDAGDCFHLFTPGEGWWGFDIKTEDAARKALAAVSFSQGAK